MDKAKLTAGKIKNHTITYVRKKAELLTVDLPRSQAGYVVTITLVITGVTDQNRNNVQHIVGNMWLDAHPTGSSMINQNQGTFLIGELDFSPRHPEPLTRLQTHMEQMALDMNAKLPPGVTILFDVPRPNYNT